MTLADDVRRLAVKVETLEQSLRASKPGQLRLVGTAEVAKLLGVNANTVASWRRRGQLPEPTVVLACGPIWLQQDIDAWRAAQ